MGIRGQAGHVRGICQETWRTCVIENADRGKMFWTSFFYFNDMQNCLLLRGSSAALGEIQRKQKHKSANKRQGTDLRTPGRPRTSSHGRFHAPLVYSGSALFRLVLPVCSFEKARDAAIASSSGRNGGSLAPLQCCKVKGEPCFPLCF